MFATLTVIGGKQPGRAIPITGTEFVIGRDEKCHLRPNSNDVSRLHCSLIVDGGRVFLRDLGGLNGTLINHRLLRKGDLQLETGDLLEVGPLQFRVTLQPAPLTAEGSPSDTKHDIGTVLGPEGTDGAVDVEDTVLSKAPAPTGDKPGRPDDSQVMLAWE